MSCLPDSLEQCLVLLALLLTYGRCIGAYHVHTIGWAIGGWELASTNMFEIFNKHEKKLVLHHSNRKTFERQIIAREIRHLVAQASDWITDGSILRHRIPSAAEVVDLKRGYKLQDREYSGLQFPLHELIIRTCHPLSCG